MKVKKGDVNVNVFDNKSRHETKGSVLSYFYTKTGESLIEKKIFSTRVLIINISFIEIAVKTNQDNTKMGNELNKNPSTIHN